MQSFLLLISTRLHHPLTHSTYEPNVSRVLVATTTPCQEHDVEQQKKGAQTYFSLCSVIINGSTNNRPFIHSAKYAYDDVRLCPIVLRYILKIAPRTLPCTQLIRLVSSAPLQSAVPRVNIQHRVEDLRDRGPTLSSPKPCNTSGTRR